MSPFDFLTNAVRAKEIAGVFARHGFAEVLQQINPPPGFLQRIIPQPRQRLSVWARLRRAAEELGPTFVKTGQLLSMRPDVIPEPLVSEFRKLQDSVKPLPFAQMREVLVEELGEDFERHFSEFDTTPVASASLAQVYRARLAGSGRLVAVKLQRPNLRKLVDADLDILSFFAAQLHTRVDALTPYNLPAVLAEIRVAFARELDFRHESQNLRYFNATNPFAATIYAPEVHEELTRERVLVMDFIEGARLDRCALPPEQARHLAREGARSLFHQVLSAGFFHADPHVGNLLVTPDGRICLLDWGQVGQLTRRMRHFLAELFEAAADADAERIVASATILAAPHRRPDFRTMEKEVTYALRENLNYTIGHQEIGRIILSLLNIFGRHGINVAQDYCLMAKAVLSIEEAARALDPGFDLRKSAEPVLRDLHRERFSPRTITRQLRRSLASAVSRLGDLPADLHRLAQRVSQDDLTINFQHRGLEDLDDAINKASSRLTLAMILGALIVGSSLIIHAGVRPHILGDLSALGVFGYVLSMPLALWIVWDIFRHGRHK